MSVNDRQLTDWFNGSKTVPGAPGVYERKPGQPDLTYRIWSYWDGKRWFCGAVNSGQTNREACRRALYHYNKGTASVDQNRDWRGLLEEDK